MIRLAHLIALAASALMLSAQAIAEPLRILHAEPVRVQSAPNTAAQKPSASDVRQMSFDAFGRRFELDLQNNDSLLAAVEPRQLQAISDLQLLRGKLRGHPESWVRLTSSNGQLEGAIWDGAELYSIESRADLTPHLLTSAVPDGGTLIYRLSDTSGGALSGSCGAEHSTALAGSEPSTQYKLLLQDLRQSAALIASREVIVSMLADHEFVNRHGVRSMQEMVSRMNIVDGIFDSQVDLNIVPSDFTTFDPGNDPFTTTDPESLLEQVGAYRAETPHIGSRALTHLITGKSLNGTVLGIAYINGVCTAETGAGLSEDSGGITHTALIIAHELGHNLGAQHDGQPGSVCNATPPTFLMAPSFTGSSTFSQCSRNFIDALVDRSSCVTPARTRDIAVSVPTSPVPGIVNQPFEYAADVSSIGEADAYNVLVSAVFDQGLTVQSASLPGAQCSHGSQVVNCSIPQLPAGTVSRLTVQLVGTTVSDYSSTVTASSSVESLTTNNSVIVPIAVRAVQDASISFSPETIALVTGEEVDVTVTVTATGVEVLDGLVAELRGSATQILSAQTAEGLCTATAFAHTCALGDLAPGESVQITARMLARSVSSNPFDGSVTLTRASSPDRAIRSAQWPITVSPRVDLAVDPLPHLTVAVIGETVEIPFIVRATGADGMPNARIHIRVDETVATELIGPNIVCTKSGWILDCALGDLAPGAVVNALLRVRSDTVVHTYIDVQPPFGSEDEIWSNSKQLVTFEARPDVDLRARETGTPFTIRDLREITLGFVFSAYGVRDPEQITATLTMPESFQLLGASIQEGTCTIEGQVVSCSLPTLRSRSNASVSVTFIASTLGTFSGSLELAAANDVDTSNNSATYTFDVLPNVDAHVSSATTEGYGFVNEPQDWEFSVVNNPYALVDGSLEVSVNTNITVDSITPSRGSCTLQSYIILCPIGTLAPSEVFTLAVRGTVALPSLSASMSARFNSPGDGDFSNNTAYARYRVVAISDLALEPPRVVGGVALSQGVMVEMDIDISGGEADEAFIEIDFDPTRVSAPVAGMASCDWATLPARCSLGSGLYAGNRRAVQFLFTPTQSGPMTISARVGARNERNVTNNEQSIELTIPAPTPPTPPPAAGPSSGSGGSGGGGGGGSTSTDQVLLLAVLLWMRMLWRRHPKFLH